MIETVAALVGYFVLGTVVGGVCLLLAKVFGLAMRRRCPLCWGKADYAKVRSGDTVMIRKRCLACRQYRWELSRTISFGKAQSSAEGDSTCSQ